MTEEVIRPCVAWPPDAHPSNTRSLLVALFRSLYGQVNSGVSMRFFIQCGHTPLGLSPFESARTVTLTTTA